MHAHTRNYQNVMIPSFTSKNLPLVKAWLHHLLALQNLCLKSGRGLSESFVDKHSLRIHQLVELQTHRHSEIADTTSSCSGLTLESPSPINTLHNIGIRKWVCLARNTSLHMTILSNLIGCAAIAVQAGVHKS